jgi:hypothetical protein
MAAEYRRTAKKRTFADRGGIIGEGGQAKV